MDIAERIRKRMKNYGYETIKDMMDAMEQQKAVDIGIFTTPVGKVMKNDGRSRENYLQASNW